MAKQLQLRRGTTVQNNAFIGAIGELTMDTDKKQLRLHDGTTQGGIEVPTAGTADYVVEWQAPNPNDGYKWYRKYKSGWIEQGGTSAVSAVRFPIAFSTTNYTISAIAEMISSDVGTISICYTNKTVDGIDIQVRWNGAGADTVSRMWFACGF